MRKKSLLFFFLLPFLTACSDYSGIATQRYDDRPISTNAEATNAYEQSYEIVGEEKELLKEKLPGFFFRETLDFSGDTQRQPLFPEPLVIGEDLPEGRYTIFKNERMESGYLTVQDRDGNTVYEHFINGMQNTLELNLYDGMQISANDGYQVRLFAVGVPAEAVSDGGFESSMPPLEKGEIKIGNGIFSIGEHLNPGTYNLEFTASYGVSAINHVYLLNPDGSFRVYEIPGNSVEAAAQLTFSPGQVLYINSANSLFLSPIEE